MRMFLEMRSEGSKTCRWKWSLGPWFSQSGSRDTTSYNSYPFRFLPISTGHREWTVCLICISVSSSLIQHQLVNCDSLVELVELTIFRAPKTSAVSDSTGLGFSSGNVAPFTDASNALNSSSPLVLNCREDAESAPTALVSCQFTSSAPSRWVGRVGLLVGRGQLQSLLLLILLPHCF